MWRCGEPYAPRPTVDLPGAAATKPPARCRVPANPRSLGAVTRCVVLVDGEHYPPVVAAAVGGLRAEGYEPVAALFLGGTEKTDRPPDLGIPVVAGGAARLAELIAEHRPATVYDLSDEPILDVRRRMALVGVALRAGVGYEGAGFRFAPPSLPRLTARPTVAVSGTGKRTGKTALAIALARHWRDRGRRVVIVTMGRGGPPEPIVLRAGEFPPDADGLRSLAERGLHAASDYVEDALFAGVDTVGTLRCGAGMSGEAAYHNFHLGVSTAEGLDPDVLIYEGSGAALPPAAADAGVLVMPADLDREYLAGYFGPYRLSLADAVVITGDGPGAGPLAEIAAAAGLPVFTAAYQAEPTLPVAGRRVLVASTAPDHAVPELRNAVAGQGAASVEVLTSLADRARLAAELSAARPADLVLIEVKAAAVDVLNWADREGLESGFLHNRLEVEDGIAALAQAMTS